MSFMNEPKTTVLGPRGRIGKQIRLPLSKAVEISLKSLKVRFWRSMLTVSSIILAIAFLTFVWGSSRLQSAVAVRVRPDAARVSEVSRAVDDAWKPFERELANLCRSRRDYQNVMKQFLTGDVRALKEFCREVENDPDPARRISLAGLPYEAQAMDTLVAKVRSIRTLARRDLSGWSHDALRLAAVKGVVQAELTRLSAIQLALQRRGIETDTPMAQLETMSPTAIWLIIISLLVCGVGITNAMLMSVSERFREIGTMKCLGALDGFIVKLFLLESTFQGVAGTAFGVLGGFVVMVLSSLGTFGRAAFDYFPALQMVTIVVSGLLIGSGLSIVGAVFPALRAAHMAPVEAMRVEE
jgi:hypothetical protein